MSNSESASSIQHWIISDRSWHFLCQATKRKVGRKEKKSPSFLLFFSLNKEKVTVVVKNSLFLLETEM